MNNIRIFLIIFFAFHIGFIYTITVADQDSNAGNNYAIIRYKFNNWDSALYGVRSYHRRVLNNLLIDLIGRNIKTGTDYIISISDILEKKYYNSDLYNAKWLHIHGRIDESTIKEITDKGTGYIKEVERNKYLFSLSGKIKKFRIIQNCAGRSVHLYLESVQLRRDF